MPHRHSEYIMSKPFQFNRFVVYDSQCAMKVGTDGVLLGAWCHATHANRLLDIGTGCGVIALMLAQKTGAHSHIDGVEMDPACAAQAQQNVSRSPWPDKVKIWPLPIQDFRPTGAYDLIVSNPPFFVNSLLPPDHRRGISRHAGELSFHDLLAAVSTILAPHGSFDVIVPADSAHAFADLAGHFHLYCRRSCSFRSRPHKKVERVLMSFTRLPGEIIKEELVLYANGDTWSDAYHALTKDFYYKRK